MVLEDITTPAGRPYFALREFAPLGKRAGGALHKAEKSLSASILIGYSQRIFI
jgi:hypothetical protein